jgi:two-component system, OmpR family, alkaline phosphatase synthesis response regulator PhoP
MNRSAVVEEPRSKPATSPPHSVVRKNRLRVLLIDDEIEHLLPLADVLDHAGFVPTIASSGDEALFDIETSPPDVVVVDAAMADPSLLSGLRAVISKRPLVLMISVPLHDARIASMLATTGVAYIEKPVIAQELLDLLSDANRLAGTTHHS